MDYIRSKGIDELVLINPASRIQFQFKKLFNLYSECHNMMNSGNVVDVALLGKISNISVPIKLVL